MRLVTILITIYLAASFQGKSQAIAFNHCDSSVLTRQEFERCKGDTIFHSDLIIRLNYITFLKTELLPKYRLQRRSFILPEGIRKNVKLLKSIYDSTVAFKIQRMTADMDTNQKFVQPKAYVSSLLALETFKFYPDVYAVLLNEIHLSFNPKTTINQMKQMQGLVDSIYSSTDSSTRDRIHHITSALTKERKAFAKDYMLDLLQCDITEAERKEYAIINFLLWTE